MVEMPDELRSVPPTFYMFYTANTSTRAAKMVAFPVNSSICIAIKGRFGILHAMKTNLKISFLSLVLLMPLICAAAARPCAGTLEAGFVSPPGSARPHVYYMIMNGNMSKECITDDFEAMAKVGIGGVLVLDVGCFMPAGPVVFASPEWYDIMLHLHKEAKRLGIEVTFPELRRMVEFRRTVAQARARDEDRRGYRDAYKRRTSFYRIGDDPSWGSNSSFGFRLCCSAEPRE